MSTTKKVDHTPKLAQPLLILDVAEIAPGPAEEVA